MNLSDLQREHKVWLDHNFPNQSDYQALLGIVEEVGELSHGHLKMEHGIRGSELEHEAAICDALGDIIIYMLSYCNATHRDLQHCVDRAWREVSQRDWQAFPDTGKPPADHSNTVEGMTGHESL